MFCNLNPYNKEKVYFDYRMSKVKNFFLWKLPCHASFPCKNLFFHILEIYIASYLIVYDTPFSSLTTTKEIPKNASLPWLGAKKISETTILHKNNETNDKFYRKVAFLMYTKAVCV